jgi:hypothetical protein
MAHACRSDKSPEPRNMGARGAFFEIKAGDVVNLAALSLCACLGSVRPVLCDLVPNRRGTMVSRHVAGNGPSFYNRPQFSSDYRNFKAPAPGLGRIAATWPRSSSGRAAQAALFRARARRSSVGGSST